MVTPPAVSAARGLFCVVNTKRSSTALSIPVAGCYGSAMSNNIRALREAKGFSQNDLDVLLNLATGTVGRWERGRIKPIPRHRRRLAKRLGCSIDELGIQPDEPEAKP